MTEMLAEQLDTEESMFVQTAQRIERTDGTLTVRGTTPSTLYFIDPLGGRSRRSRCAWSAGTSGAGSER